MSDQVIILIPVLNDWVCLKKLQDEILKVFENDFVYSFLIINDGSTEYPDNLNFIDSTIIHLQRNIGHQQAIAIGLSFIHENIKCEKVLVMDSDGEDSPEDALRLLNASDTENKIVFAQRKTRTEKSWFRLFYRAYKVLFKALTGQKIAYGNFVVIPKHSIDKLVYYSEIWNHLAGTILKSKLTYTSIPTRRGMRYTGKSSMNFYSLILHGLGAIGVFTDVLVARLLVVSFASIALSLLGGAIIIAIRYFTDLAVPGWASVLLASTIIVLLQGLMLSLFTFFIYLSSQSQRKFIPALHYNDYIRSIEYKNESTSVSG